VFRLTQKHIHAIYFGTEFAKKLWGANLIVCLSMTSLCSPNRSTTCL